jgi:NADPH:quinone reductase-like Zn-dependent oxidoreductase
MTFEEAASLAEGFLTALPFLRDEGGLGAGQAVLINGASGSVGSAAVQIARHFGARVTGVCGPANVALVRSLGADAVIDYTREDFTQARDRYDIVFDTVGKSSFARCKPALKAHGVYLCPVISARIIAQTLVTGRSAGKRARFATTGLRKAADKVSDLALLARLQADGAIKAVIDRRYALEEMREAHRYVEGGHKRGSVVIRVGSNAAAA